jgi:hypothetical protein
MPPRSLNGQGLMSDAAEIILKLVHSAEIILELVQRVQEIEDRIGVLSGEQLAVAKDLLDEWRYTMVLEAVNRLGDDWLRVAIDVPKQWS